MKARIVGIFLVRNEDLFIETALSNVAEFCDRIVIADHRSTDITGPIAQRFVVNHPHADYHKIHHPKESHDLIKGYAGSDTWIFGVDGDELYEQERLHGFRKELSAGKYDRCWMVLGNVLHCTQIDAEGGKASGYLAPPCRSMTKFYNFKGIESWDGACTERLHGGNVIFKPGFDAKKRCDIYKKTLWEDASFRCLHMCFVQRSSKDNIRPGSMTVRKNIADKNAQGIFLRMAGTLFTSMRHHHLSATKRGKYMRGDLVRKDVRAFFR